MHDLKSFLPNRNIPIFAKRKIPMAQIIILLGGNIGNVKNTFNEAINLLGQKLSPPLKCSSIYTSEAWGFEAKEKFFNQIIEFNSELPPQDILEVAQGVEKTLGRQRNNATSYQSRPIDIDILFIDNKTICTENLTIPHPLLHLRRFTMEPLREHWSKIEHPVLHKNVETLYEQCPDHSLVVKE